MVDTGDGWPDELYDTDEWPELVKKPDAIYLSGGTAWIDVFSGQPVRLGDFGETEIISTKKVEDF